MKGYVAWLNSVIVVFFLSSITWQNAYTEVQSQSKGKKNSAEYWLTFTAESMMKRYTPDQLPKPGLWTYHHGFFLFGLDKVYRYTGDRKYLDYIKTWADLHIDDQGNISPYNPIEYNIDNIMPGRVVLLLYRETGDERYRKAAYKLRLQAVTMPRNKSGGFWHQLRWPYQMWLDGLYMAQPYCVEMGVLFKEPAFFDEAVFQLNLMAEKSRDPKTGLMYHAWDESGTAPWANPMTHCSPEFWCRALGWYSMALVDCLDYIPENHPGRAVILNIMQDYFAAIARVQDKKTGLWYQVMDKGDRPENWLESSSTSMFVYSFLKAVEKGYIDASYADIAVRAYDGLLNNVVKVDENGLMELTNICVGTDVGDYNHYINRQQSKNDLHGVGAFLLASWKMAEFQKKEK